MIRSNYLYLNYVLYILATFTAVSMFIFDENIIEGFKNIITSSGVLFTDYLTVGGISATLLNVTLITSLNLYLIKLFKIRVSGAVFAAVFIVMGFAFFGKNVVNVLPIYFGTYLYSLSEGRKFSSYFAIAMFATGLAPIVSFGFDKGALFIVIGIILGILYGFIIPTFSVHVIRFHGGYTLYNVGFAGGIISILIYSMLELFSIKNTITPTYSTEHSTFLLLLLFSISLLYLIASVLTEKTNKTYKKLLSMSGRAITDFTMIMGKRLSYFNVGVLGITVTFLLLVFQIQVSGIIFGAAMTLVGFGTFGKHIKNTAPIIFGVLITGYLFNNQINHGTIVIALFATSLAPIAGDFGLVAGIVAGVFHFSIVSRSAMWQGGMNLYNNGFAAGFVAAIISSVLDTVEFKRLFWRKDNETS